VIVAVVSQLAASAQVAFDVASIKENKSLDAGGSFRLMPGGGITAQHLPARGLITIAYQLQPFQLINAPEWARTTSYDVIARTAAPVTRDQNLTMLQALLVDRFALAFHRESRELDGFSLVRVRPDRLGAGLQPSAVDCSVAFAVTPRCREGGITSTSMKAVGVPISSILVAVVGRVVAPVRDDTQLAGTFDVDLRWSTDVGSTDDLRPIDIAIQEQLGLKLERRRIRTEMFVVDRLERATPD
jgi:uncharacterized protein (TIGR03435 family)